MRPLLTAEGLARFGRLPIGRCWQARRFGDLFPGGFDIEANARALLTAIPRIRELGLDIVYGTTYLADEERDAEKIQGFVDLIIRQGDGLIGNRYFIQARGNTVAKPTKANRYRLAKLTRMALWQECGKQVAMAARNEQEQYCIDILKEMADGA